MNQALIFGLNDFAEVLYYHLQKTPDAPKIIGFTANSRYCTQPRFSGLPVFPLETLPQSHPADQYGVYVCVGYSAMNAHRRHVYEALRTLGYPILSFIHPTAQIDAERVGEGTIALQNVVVDAGCVLGDGNIFYAGALLAHHSQMGDFNFMAVSACIAGHVTIGDRCFFGAHSTVRNGVAVADETLVGAGAYLSESSHEREVIVPARSLTLRESSSDFNL